MNVLILGASGQLGQCISSISANHLGLNLQFPEEGAANILDHSQLKNLFEENKPEYVINCAAYTAVDKAEDDVELCRNVNKVGAVNIAKLCVEYGAVLVHVSTDFVFEGNTPELLKEDDVANPINVYGLTKLEGEVAISEILPQHFIIRTSWLYSEFANNFVKTMLRLGAERDELNIIADQIGTPTYAVDLAETILTIIESRKADYGIYHYSNEGVTSWYDFAVGIFELSNANVVTKPIPTSMYPTRAQRPKFSVMDKSKIKRVFEIQIPYWRTSLSRCISRLSIDKM